MTKWNEALCAVMRLLGNKEKSNKLTITIRGGRLVRVCYPEHIFTDQRKFAAARQRASCYEIQLNGNPLLFRGLG